MRPDKTSRALFRTRIGTFYLHVSGRDELLLIRLIEAAKDYLDLPADLGLF
jgi:hypothetical protein